MRACNSRIADPSSSPKLLAYAGREIDVTCYDVAASKASFTAKNVSLQRTAFFTAKKKND